MGTDNTTLARDTLTHEENNLVVDNETARRVSELKRYVPLLPLIAGLACSRV